MPKNKCIVVAICKNNFFLFYKDIKHILLLALTNKKKNVNQVPSIMLNFNLKNGLKETC